MSEKVHLALTIKDSNSDIKCKTISIYITSDETAVDITVGTLF